MTEKKKLRSTPIYVYKPIPYGGEAKRSYADTWDDPNNRNMFLEACAFLQEHIPSVENAYHRVSLEQVHNGLLEMANELEEPTDK